MTLSTYAALVIMVLLVMVAIKTMRPRRGTATRRRHGSVGPAAAGAFYELLNEDRRKAIEVVVEEKAGYRDPEHADDLPAVDDPPAAVPGVDRVVER
jgi:hypothetical protein